MRYGIILVDPVTDYADWYFADTPADGPAQHVFDLMECDFVDKQLDLCKLCDVQGHRCHVVEDQTGRKFCPVLFADAVHPPWKVDQIA